MATSVQCSRESTCTAFRLHQPNEKNSDFAQCDAFGTLRAHLSTHADNTQMQRAIARFHNKSAASVDFSDIAITLMKYGIFAISQLDSPRFNLCAQKIARTRATTHAKRGECAILSAKKFFHRMYFLVMHDDPSDQN